MCLDIYSQHTCDHINHREILLCSRPITPACHQVVVMEEASPCFNCLHLAPPEDIPPPPQPAPFPVPVLTMANPQRPYVHYLDYNVPPQVVQVGIPPGGQGPIHTYHPAQPYPAQPQQGGFVYAPPPVQGQYQGIPYVAGYTYYPGYGYIASTLPPPTPGQPYHHGVLGHAWLAPNTPPQTFYIHPQQAAQAQAQAQAQALSLPAVQPWQHNFIPPQVHPQPQAPPPPPAVPQWQQNFVPPQRQFTPQDIQAFQPRTVPVEILPNPIAGQPPLHHPIVGTNAHRMPALPAQAVRQNIFYINNTPCVQLRNPPPGQPIQLVPAPPGAVADLPTIEVQAAEAGTPLVPPAAGFVPELRWVCIRDEWRAHVHYVPVEGVDGGPPGVGGGRRLGGYNPLHGWDQGGLPPGFVSRDDFHFFSEGGNEEDRGNGEGSSGGRVRVEVESVQVLDGDEDEDEVSSQTQTPRSRETREESPFQSAQPQSSSPFLRQSPLHEKEEEKQNLNCNPTESAINTPLPPSPSCPSSSHQPAPHCHQNLLPLSAYANSKIQNEKTKKRVRFIFPARENSTSPSPHHSPILQLHSPLLPHSPVRYDHSPVPPNSPVSNTNILPHLLHTPAVGLENMELAGAELEIMENDMGSVEVEGVEVEGVVYVNASTQTLPVSCLSRRFRDRAGGRRVRFDVDVDVFVFESGVDVEGVDGLGLGIESVDGVDGLGIEGLKIENGNEGGNDGEDGEEKVVYVDAETQTPTQTDGLVSSSDVLPDVSSIDAKSVHEGNGKGKEKESVE